MDSAELARWTRFAAKGGIGKCTALSDCVAENEGDLMFLKDDEVVVLMQLNEQEGNYLGYCEGVVGRFSGSDVRFHGKLKKPIMTKRSSTSTTGAKSPSPRQSTAPQSPVRASTDDEKAIAYSASSFSIDSMISPSHSIQSSIPTSRSTSVDSSPVDQMLSIASAISRLENGPASPQVTAPLRVPKKPSQISLSPSPYVTEKPTSQPGTPLRPEIPLQDGQPVTIAEQSYSSCEDPSTRISVAYSDGGVGIGLTILQDGQPATIAEQSYSSYDDPSTRISVAYSDGGVGIGLTMLQTLINDDDEDDDNWSQSSRYSTRLPQGPVDTHVNMNETQVPRLNEPNEIHNPCSTESTIPLDSKIPSRSPSPSARSLSQDPPCPVYDTEARRASLAPSANSATSSSSWENAIYDDYRYSRYSMAGKMARFSTVSTMGGIASSNEQPPPIPEPRLNMDSRPSVDSRSSVDSRPNADFRPSVESQPSAELDRAEAEVQPPPRSSSLNFHKFRWPNKPPIPLTLQHQSPEAQLAPDVRSPLLHTNWGSPVSSKHESAASFYTTSSLAHASQSSHQLADENERSGSRASHISGDGHAAQIVVEDDEELPSHVISSAFHESPSSSPEPALDRSEGENADSSAADDAISKAIASETDVTLVVPLYASPLASPAVPLPPPSTPGNSSNCPRLSLADLRGDLIPGTNQRQSLFLPHPNAPKPPGMLSAGPMYVQPAESRAFAGQPGPPRINSVGIIHMTLSRLLPSIGGHPYQGPTIYGRTETALSMSVGPVPISFSLEPFPSTGPLLHPPMSPQRIDYRSPATAPIRELNEMPRSPERCKPQPHNERPILQLPSNPIPRPNFSPKTPGIRPRSRSFSGFDSAAADLPHLGEKRDASDLLGTSDMKRSLSAKLTISTSSFQTSSPPTLPPSPFAKPIVRSSPLRSSPLSLSQNGASASEDGANHTASPKSPVANPNDSPLSPAAPNLQKLVTKLALSDSTSPRPPAGIPPPNRSSGPISPIDGTSEKQSIRPSTDTDSVSINSDSKSFLTSGASATGRQNSLRVKLSLPNLIKSRCKQDETSSLASGSQTHEVDTVQVKDTGFELVTPSITFFSNRDSEEFGRDGSLEPPLSLIPPGSPALSTFSSRSAPDAMSPTQESSPLRPSPEAEQSIDAHRQRELRWVSVMSTVSPVQSRKTKKVKKLLLEGVPASVRYLVWSYVTNGRARIVAGVYAQLASRGRVAVSDRIEADVHRCFNDHPQLQGRESPILTVLQAYLNMVPDVQYSAGLTMIVGQLLLQGPEEEVFWIFISLMDSYLRPYFSNCNIQLEVDATLFSRALEANDPPIAKRILMDLNIPPDAICADWFKSVFVDTLPTDYVNRVWDIFMYEGIPFLIRVGLAVINCCRVQILQSPNDNVLLDVIRHPPLNLLPPNADAFVALALDQKLKDDDVRKQRIKMEAQVKRQTQAQAPRKSTANAIISLPRS